jgi:serine/threonine protein kinase
MAYNIGEIVLSKFKVDEWLGGGIYTQVLRVVRLNTHEFRTLKLIRPESSSLDSSRLAWLKERFQLEANLLDQVSPPHSHSNLLEVYGYYELGGTPALERQYASHGSLASLLEAARYSGKRILLMKALKIALEAADGLSVLHKREIIHRDLKPSNILIDAYQNVRISDLYLAQIPAGLGLAQPVGTPDIFFSNSAYLSPEQIHSHSKLTPPSDVYALGAILFEMLTGVKYSNVGSGTHLHSIRADIPDWLDELVSRMVALEPEKRPWSGAIVSALLRAGLDSMVEGDNPLGAWETPEENELSVPASQSAIPRTKPEPQAVDNDPSALLLNSELKGVKGHTQVWEMIVNLKTKWLKNPAYIVFSVLLVVILLWLLILIVRR